MESIATLLKRDKIIIYKIKGKSMEPMLLQNQDLVTIKIRNKIDPLCINDIVLYYNHNRVLTLHRIIEIINNDFYTLLGDNSSKKECRVKNEDIIGKLIGFKHGGVHFEVTDCQYLEYVYNLRKKEKSRIRRKYIYDFIIQHTKSIIPNSKIERYKLFLKRIICKQVDIIL